MNLNKNDNDEDVENDDLTCNSDIDTFLCDEHDNRKSGIHTSTMPSLELPKQPQECPAIGNTLRRNRYYENRIIGSDRRLASQCNHNDEKEDDDGTSKDRQIRMQSIDSNGAKSKMPIRSSNKEKRKGEHIDNDASWMKNTIKKNVHFGKVSTVLYSGVNERL